MKNTFQDRMVNYIRAGYPAFALVHYGEEVRVQAELMEVAASTQEKTGIPRQIFSWDCVHGAIDAMGASVPGDTASPKAILSAFTDPKVFPSGSILILEDYHRFFDDSVLTENPDIIGLMKTAINHAKAEGLTLILAGVQHDLPPELIRDVLVINYALPDRERLRGVMDGVIGSAGDKWGDIQPDESEVELLLDAAAGMTTSSAENAFALSLVSEGKLDHSVISREKAADIAKDGMVEIMDTGIKLEDIGGLENMLEWAQFTRLAFLPENKHLVANPKGMVIVGISGTGKSLCAKAISNILGGLPCLRVDIGSLMGRHLGESEENWRKVIEITEAIGKSVLWLDEVEKMFAGAESSGETDGGTTSRMLASFLTWMQEKKSPTFVCATANDVTKLPPEFLRKGRFDEMFFVDLPTTSDREQIWRIHATKAGYSALDTDDLFLDYQVLAKQTVDWTGAEIEGALDEARREALATESKRVTTDLLLGIVRKTTPLAQAAPEPITRLREWAKARAIRQASKPEPGTGKADPRKRTMN